MMPSLPYNSFQQKKPLREPVSLLIILFFSCQFSFYFLPEQEVMSYGHGMSFITY